MFDPQRRCTPVAEWPAADRAAWEAALARPDLLEPYVGVAHRWAATSRVKIVNGYGRWLGWLERAGRLDPTSSPSSRATRDQVRDYLAMLTDMSYAPYTIAGRLQELGDALRAMAPDQDWRWISRAAGRVHEQARPVKDLAGRMRPADEVLQLGLDLMHAAENDRFRTDFDRAVLYRDGLTLAALIHRPLRIKNFASIALGRHLQRRGDSWWMYFEPAEVKTASPLEMPWPDELHDALERYLAVHRAVLLEGAVADALWISKGGAGATTDVLGHRVTKRTGDEFGVAINPHTFRHIAATTIATDDPENITGVAGVLGHSTLETSEKHYNKAKMVDASERYQQTVHALRRNRGRRAHPDQGELGL